MLYSMKKMAANFILKAENRTSLFDSCLWKTKIFISKYPFVYVVFVG